MPSKKNKNKSTSAKKNQQQEQEPPAAAAAAAASASASSTNGHHHRVAPTTGGPPPASAAAAAPSPTPTTNNNNKAVGQPVRPAAAQQQRQQVGGGGGGGGGRSRTTTTSTTTSSSSTTTTTQQHGLSSVYFIDVAPRSFAYRFDVDILVEEPYATGGGIKRPSSLVKGPGGGSELTRRACFELIAAVFAKTHRFGMGPADAFVYDGRAILYTSADAKIPSKTVVTFEEAPPAARSVYNKPGTLFTVHIQPCGTADARCLDLTDLSQYQPLTQPAAGVQNGGQQANGDGGHAAEDRSVRAFFELAIAQKALESGDYMAIGQGKLFKRDPLPLPYGGRVVQPSVSLHAGICKGVRVVEGDELLEKQQGLKKLKAAVVLDVKVGAFLTCQTLDKAIAECAQGARNGEDWQQFLKRVRVQCVHNPSRTFAIAGFGNKPLAEEEGIPHAQPNGGTETTWESVPDYFFRTYRKQLQNTRLPAVIPAGRPGERHPAEMLRILPGQKIPLEKQSAELSAELMKRSSVLPNQRQQRIEEAGADLQLWPPPRAGSNTNLVLCAFGITVRRESNSCAIELLPMPHLRFAGGRPPTAPSGDKADWSRQAGPFLQAGKGPSNWMVVCDGHNRGVVEKFVERLTQVLEMKGLKMNRPVIVSDRYEQLIDPLTSQPRLDGWVDLFFRCASKPIGFLMLIDDLKVTATHELLKLLEVYRFVTGGKGGRKPLNCPLTLTQHVTSQVVEKVVHGGQHQTLENIAMKINTKLAGVTYAPAVTGVPQASENAFCLDGGRVLVIGLDVSHHTGQDKAGAKCAANVFGARSPFPPPQPPAPASSSSPPPGSGPPAPQLQNGDGCENCQNSPPATTEEAPAPGPPGSSSSPSAGGGARGGGGPPLNINPSIVGICANTAAHPHAFTGDYFFQAPRKESIDGQMLRRRARWLLGSLDRNRKAANRPQYVVVLRDGLSEGQLEMAYHDELAAIREGFADHDSGYAPKLVLVVASKRHTKKFFSTENAEQRPENLTPCSVIQNKVVRPDVLEFFLQSHHPIKGTGQSVQYVVRANETGFSGETFLRSIQSLVTALCFSHQIVHRPTSLPQPIHQADVLATRGANNLHALMRYFPADVPRTASGAIDCDALNSLLCYWADGTRFLDRRVTA